MHSARPSSARFTPFPPAAAQATLVPRRPAASLAGLVPPPARPQHPAQGVLPTSLGGRCGQVAFQPQTLRWLREAPRAQRGAHTCRLLLTAAGPGPRRPWPCGLGHDRPRAPPGLSGAPPSAQALPAAPRRPPQCPELGVDGTALGPPASGVASSRLPFPWRCRTPDPGPPGQRGGAAAGVRVRSEWRACPLRGAGGAGVVTVQLRPSRFLRTSEEPPSPAARRDPVAPPTGTRRTRGMLHAAEPEAAPRLRTGRPATPPVRGPSERTHISARLGPGPGHCVLVEPRLARLPPGGFATPLSISARDSGSGGHRGPPGLQSGRPPCFAFGRPQGHGSPSSW